MQAKELNTQIKSAEIITGYISGIERAITKMHYDYYQEHYSFGEYFKSMVSQKLDSFFKFYTLNRDCIWSLHINKKIEGSILIDGSEKETLGAHLLLFFVSKHYRGFNFGNQLINEAITFCKENCFAKIYLRTFKQLDIARYLYEKNNFQMVNEAQSDRWGRTMTVQKYELVLR